MSNEGPTDRALFLKDAIEGTKALVAASGLEYEKAFAMVSDSLLQREQNAKGPAQAQPPPVIQRRFHPALEQTTGRGSTTGATGPLQPSIDVSEENKRRWGHEDLHKDVRGSLRPALLVSHSCAPPKHMQPHRTLMLSAIAHGLLISNKTLSDDGNLPRNTRAPKLFSQGKQAAATHTHSRRLLQAVSDDGEDGWHKKTAALMKWIGKRKNATGDGPKSFIDCLRIVEPNHPLLATGNAFPAQGATGTGPTSSASISQHESSRRPSPASSNARAPQEKAQAMHTQLHCHDLVSLLGLREYIHPVTSGEGSKAGEWVLIANATLMSDPCPGFVGDCGCGVKHENNECVCVVVESILEEPVCVSAPTNEGAIRVAKEAMAGLREPSVLERGTRVVWPTSMMSRPILEVIASRTLIKVKKEKKVKKVKTGKKAGAKRGQTETSREGKPPTVTTQSGRQVKLRRHTDS